jgi:predicted lysophospholipase L1 biosynthesis ABC-type transport system permease subunit
MGQPEAAIPFATAPKAVNSDDLLDQAGYIVIGMLEQAAAVAAQNCQHAVDVAQKVSLKLRAAEDRVKDLEAETAHCQERAARAEQWLMRISREIEQRFLDAKADRSHPAPWHQSALFGRDLEAAE